MNPTEDEIRALVDTNVCGAGEDCPTCAAALARLPDFAKERYLLARPLAEEVLRLRKLLVDLDIWGVSHKTLCAKTQNDPCDCGADDLQRRINEATS